MHVKDEIIVGVPFVVGSTKFFGNTFTEVLYSSALKELWNSMTNSF